MTRHCPGCRGYHIPPGAMQPFPHCPGCQSCDAKDKALAVADEMAERILLWRTSSGHALVQRYRAAREGTR